MLHSTIAWKNGQWLPFHQVHLSLDDWGVLQGAVVVDRLRTIKSVPLDIDAHVQRLKANCELIGIQWDDEISIEDVIRECAQHNRSRLQQADFSIVVLITPGLTGQVQKPTAIVHAQSLNFKAMRHWYEHGQQIVVSENRNVPAACWPPNLKNRSRLHYYLADRAASNCGEPYCAAALLDIDGNVTETSAANILCVDSDGTIHCPPLDAILNGISLQRTLRLARSLSIQVEHHPLSVAFVESSSEVLLTGTSACIWPASQFGRAMIPDSTNRPIYKRLLSAWIDDVGCDFRVLN